MSRKRALLLSLAACLLFLCVSLARTLRLPAEGEVAAAARPVSEAELLTGRDEPGRLPTELLPGQKVDLNSASLEELSLLPGIGQVLSQAILDYRAANGPFESPEELLQVPGIGPVRYEALANLITIGDKP